MYYFITLISFFILYVFEFRKFHHSFFIPKSAPDDIIVYVLRGDDHNYYIILYYTVVDIVAYAVDVVVDTRISSGTRAVLCGRPVWLTEGDTLYLRWQTELGPLDRCAVMLPNGTETTLSDSAPSPSDHAYYAGEGYPSGQCGLRADNVKPGTGDWTLEAYAADGRRDRYTSRVTCIGKRDRYILYDYIRWLLLILLPISNHCYIVFDYPRVIRPLLQVRCIPDDIVIILSCDWYGHF